MPLYSKEYLKKVEKNDVKPSFSIRKTFFKMPDDTNKELICDGFGIRRIINRDGDCFLILDNDKEITYEQLTGKRIGENYSQLINLGLIITAAWILSGLVVYLTYKQKGYEARGTFGDMFGAVNALFSGLALGGIIYTIYLQKNELKLQRKELRQTREEFTAQNKTLSLQRFENTFFQMLNLHHEIVDKLQFEILEDEEDPFSNSKKIERRQVISLASDRLVVELTRKNLGYITKKENKDKDIEIEGAIGISDIAESYKLLTEGYVSFYESFESNLSHYFRSLYHIFKYIYETDFASEDEPFFYSSIVRAQLSHEEQHLLYYNAMVDGLGNPKFLFLVKHFDLMQNFGKHPMKKFGNHEKIFEILISNVTVEHYESDTPVQLISLAD